MEHSKYLNYPKETTLNVSVVTLSARDNQKLSKCPSKAFERSVYWNENKTKSESKTTSIEYKFFIKSNYRGMKILFVLPYLNCDNDRKSYKARSYYLLKRTFNNYIVIINGKNIYDQPINYDIKRFQEIKRLTTGKGEDYNTGYLLNYEYIKIHYRLIAVALGRRKEFDTDPKATQQIEFVAQLKNEDRINTDGGQFMLVLMILKKKLKKNRLKFSQVGPTVFKKMANYEEARVKPTYNRL